MVYCCSHDTHMQMKFVLDFAGVLCESGKIKNKLHTAQPKRNHRMIVKLSVRKGYWCRKNNLQWLMDFIKLFTRPQYTVYFPCCLTCCFPFFHDFACVTWIMAPLQEIFPTFLVLGIINHQVMRVTTCNYPQGGQLLHKQPIYRATLKRNWTSHPVKEVIMWLKLSKVLLVCSRGM